MGYRYSGIFITNSFEETQRLGEKFAKDTKLRRPCSSLNIALYGELGSGKTTFVQGLAKGLGITRRIISPTFIIVRSYKLRFKICDLRFKNFYHIDLYRIKSDRDIEGLGLEEIMNDPQNIVAIEWADKIGGLLPKRRWNVRFEYMGEDKRRIIIEKLESQNPKSLPRRQAGETISKFK